MCFTFSDSFFVSFSLFSLRFAELEAFSNVAHYLYKNIANRAFTISKQQQQRQRQRQWQRQRQQLR